MTPIELMQKARAQLLISDRFYGILAMHLELKEDSTCVSAWTDGETIGFNPEFISSLTDYERMFVFKHEVFHPLLSHHLRREGRDKSRWNDACDRVIHYQFKHQERMELIKDALYDPYDYGLNAEAIYNKILVDQEPKPGIGEVRDFKGSNEDNQPTSSEKSQQEGKWVQALERAVKESEKFGKIPGYAYDLLEAKKKPKINWREVLRRFVQESLDSSDYNWMKPNKKFSEIYIPSLAINQSDIEHIVFAIDTSGSMSKDDLDQVVNELSLILEEYKTKITVLLVDTMIHKVLEFTEEDLPIKIEAVGRGGTDFNPAFEWVTKNEIEPTCFLYFTDGWGYYPIKEPNYPVLWIGTRTFNPPFGEMVGI